MRPTTVRSSHPTPGAAFAGFIALVPANAMASLLRKGSGKTSIGTWLLSQATGAGHLVFCGLLSALVLYVWLRFRPSRIARFDLLALFAFVTLVGWFAVGPDFGNFVERTQAVEKVPPGLFGALFCLVSVAFWVLLARLVARRVPWVMVGVGVALGFANNFLLELDYPGIHLTIGWCAALVATVGFAAEDLRQLRPSRRLLIVTGALAPLAVASLVLRPNEAAWRKLSEAPGAFPAPFVSDLVPELSSLGADADPTDPWMSRRDKVDAVPPSGLSPVPPDGIVILLVCDALRADVVERKHALVPMPNLERLRKRSVEFTLARSAAPSTLSSMTTLFSGKYYSELHAKGSSGEEGGTAGDETPRVPELLAPGVSSFHVFPTRLLDPSRGATRGFEAAKVAEKAPSSKVMDKLKRRFADGIEGPQLIYLHWMDAHAPYDLDGTQGTPKEAYLREVAILDKRLGELVNWLKDKDVADRTTLIVTADHGEAFGEHGTWEHGKTVYEELLRVPLLIAAPGKKARVVKAPVSTVDIGATILDLFGKPTPGYFMGESLLPLAYGDAKRISHPVAAEAGSKLRAFFATPDIKVIFDRKRKTTEVYDLSVDPGETQNIVDLPAMRVHVQRARRFFAVHQVKDAK